MILFSPPYSDMMGSSRHANSTLAEEKKNFSNYADFKNRGNKNIGNLKYRKVVS